MQESTRVLILGGSNFMGKELVDYLSQHIAKVEIYLINRGKKYWYSCVDLGITKYTKKTPTSNTFTGIVTNTNKCTKPSSTWTKKWAFLLTDPGRQSWTLPPTNGGICKAWPRPCLAKFNCTSSYPRTPCTTIRPSMVPRSGRSNIRCKICIRRRRGGR